MFAMLYVPKVYFFPSIISLFSIRDENEFSFSHENQ